MEDIHGLTYSTQPLCAISPSSSFVLVIELYYNFLRHDSPAAMERTRTRTDFIVCSRPCCSHLQVPVPRIYCSSPLHPIGRAFDGGQRPGQSFVGSATNITTRPHHHKFSRLYSTWTSSVVVERRSMDVGGGGRGG